LSTNDQQFLDQFSLVIGILIAVGAALAIAAPMIASPVQRAVVADIAMHQQQVNERLRPFGRVALTGEAAAEEHSAAVAAPAPVAAPLSGPQVFNQACNACHGAGIAGAPKLGDKAAWAPRIAQGVATLNKHALEGFQGQQGVMPAKGGFVDLSDAEVTAAVEYILSQSK